MTTTRRSPRRKRPATKPPIRMHPDTLRTSERGTLNRCRQRFWSKVDVRGPDDCWPWKDGCSKKGYGVFGINAQPRRAHRVAFALTHDRWPKPCCLHRCDNPPCCNPAHLVEGTNAQNRADSVAKNRHYQKITLAQASEMKRRWLAGESSVKLAEEFGVTDGHVRNVGRGRDRRAA